MRTAGGVSARVGGVRIAVRLTFVARGLAGEQPGVQRHLHQDAVRQCVLLEGPRGHVRLQGCGARGQTAQRSNQQRAPGIRALPGPHPPSADVGTGDVTSAVHTEGLRGGNAGPGGATFLGGIPVPYGSPCMRQGFALPCSAPVACQSMGTLNRTSAPLVPSVVAIAITRAQSNLHDDDSKCCNGNRARSLKGNTANHSLGAPVTAATR